jgi:hypothetical protein
MDNLVENIRNAVGKLDTALDTDWTQAGLPSVDRVRELAGDPSITRPDIEAACPKSIRISASEAAENAKEEQAADAAPASEAGDTQEQAGEDEPAQTPAPDSKADQEDAPEGPEAGEDVGESDMSVGDFMVRGMLMSVIMRLPAPMRIMADVVMLDDMADFVASFPMHEERMVAVEMIRSISETKQQEIPSKQYKPRVLAAMDVVRGDLDHVRTGIVPADDRNAAAARLARITGQGTAPVPGAAMSSALIGATDDQAAAHARLFGGSAEGVRSADE